MIVEAEDQPVAAREFEAMVCWMADEEMRPGGKYAIKHTTRWARALVREIAYRIDVNTLHRIEGVDTLSLNEIGRVQLRVTQPLFVDTYLENRQTGSFILVDERTNKTVAAGVIGRATVAA
jgi:bifunctional enzyme CysN/CysC